MSLCFQSHVKGEVRLALSLAVLLGGKVEASCMGNYRYRLAQAKQGGI